ncbi:hypothetical protein EYF80_052088 [Liparis tanakae]|uniref:Uncharacterized protein n=1 Tax=Liparis tanakae TaxID=230148 RepID=A0A4Z2F9A4_9TELE|nr:hypothetical protein EYF80_052088 [Liparis tanakae]
MRRQKRYTAEEACELILNYVGENNDQEDNPEHPEEESTEEEDSGSEDKETNDEVIDPTYRPHATSSSEEAPTSPAAEMEEGYEVKEHDDVGSEAEMEDVSEVEDCIYNAEEESTAEEESEMEDVSEVEDCTYYEEEESTDEEESEEEDPAAREEYFQWLTDLAPLPLRPYNNLER